MDKKLNEGLTKLKEDYISRIMAYLKTGVFSMAPGVTYMQAHTIVWEIGNRDIKKSPMALHQLFLDTLSEYINDIAIPKIFEKTGKEIISEFSYHWQNYTILTYWLIKPFQFLERDFLSRAKKPKLCQSSLNMFQEHIFNKVIKRIVKSLFMELEAERGGELVDWIKMKKTLLCFRVMGLTLAEVIKDDNGDLTWNGTFNLQFYKENFEKEYIKQTTEYYEEEAKKWINTLSCPEYVHIATSSLAKEEAKVINFLDAETRPELTQALENKIIVNYAMQLAKMEKTGVTVMLHNKKIAELKAITNLFSRCKDQLEHILNKLLPYIVERGKTIREAKEVVEDPVKYMSKLVEFKKEMDLMMDECFSGLEPFIKTNNIAFQAIMDDFDLTPKFMASYIDYLMRQGLRGKEKESEAMIEDIFGLFKLLKPKDAFTEHHKELYALRLLQHTSISDQLEESLITKMKIELGAQHVSKYLQMGTDMQSSKTQTEQFKKESHGGVVSGVEMDIKILTSGLWGQDRNIRCKLPAEIKNCCERFEHFYKKLHSGRHLVWNAGLGDCEISATKFKKPYTFITTVYQAAILNLYNLKDSYTFEELCHETLLSEEIMSKQMFNLTNPKFGKLLIKENLKTPKFGRTEKVSINYGFSSVSLRMTMIPTIVRRKALEEHQKENEAGIKEVNKQRCAILQATIVKIMKGRRQESHNELIREVVKQVNSFRPDPMMIKQQIEWLIESDYLMRDEKDRSKYIYKP